MQYSISDIAESVASLFPLALGILSIVCSWKIFTDRGEAGWKSLIPFYSWVVFGRCAGEESKGRKMMITGILTVICSIIFYGSLTAVLSKGEGQDSLPSVILALSGIASSVLFLLTVIYSILLKARFVEHEKDSGWIALLWILVPAAGSLYYAFLKQPSLPQENRPF